MRFALSKPSWKKLAIPMLMTIGLPPLVPVLVFAQAWVSPGSFPYAIVLPVLSLVLGYLYFPVLIARKHFFEKHNRLKSSVLGLLGIETFRQFLICAYATSGKPIGALIQEHCSGDVETLHAAISCGTAGAATLVAMNFSLWLLPATLLSSISIRHQSLPDQYGAGSQESAPK